MEINAYQLPQNNDIYIQQNLITAISPKIDNDSLHIFANQSVSYKQILGQSVFPLTSELGFELNHYYQTSLYCSYTMQDFYLNSSQKSVINNFWHCGNSFAVAPYAASVVHPKIKIFGGAGQAYGKEVLPNGVNSNIVLYFWTIKPVLSIETNISQSIKFSLGGGYQFVFSSSSSDLSKNASGLEALASFSFNLT